jgi:hypothetical protein
MISNVPKFVTPTDFENYWGTNLNEVLKDTSNLSNKANMFLKQVEDEIISHINARTNRTYDWDNLTPYQYEHMQMAVLIQANYELLNGKIGLDSGYDPAKGLVATPSSLNAIRICGEAIEQLKAGALYNQNIQNRRRFTRFY